MKQLIKVPFLFLFLSLSISACKKENKETAEVVQVEDDQDSIKNISEKTLKTILFFGNSITAGYGLEPEESFPSLVQNRLDSLSLPYKAINAGLSGETTAGGAERIDWVLKQPVDIFVLELGANDGLRGLKLTETKKNLQIIIDKVRAKYPDCKIILAGMEMPPSMGAAYTGSFRKLFPELAKENNTLLVPFLLLGVGGETRLNQPDGIHPTAAGYKIVLENVWVVLKDIL